MLNVKIIAIGDLKEKYLRDACEEYKKRISAWAKIEEIALKEEKLGDNPSEAQIKNALIQEEKRVLEKISPKAYVIAMCVEGKQFSSEELASRIEGAFSVANEICFVIGSSHGLDDSVKNAADLKLSVSKLTFPHQLMRVVLLESIYRCLNIIKGTKYHK